MSTLKLIDSDCPVAIELRTINWFGHRIFMELRPGENKDIIEAQAVQTFRDLVAAMRKQSLIAISTRGVKRIKPS